MREILFRGKRVDKDEWVEGMPCSDYRGSIDAIQAFNGGIYDIIPETFGQYTVLTDKNGKKIFEGDIVQYQPEYWCEPLQSVVEYYAEKWNYPAFDLKDHNYAANGLQCAHEEGGCEVIGNEHDNPELLR